MDCPFVWEAVKKSKSSETQVSVSGDAEHEEQTSRV